MYKIISENNSRRIPVYAFEGYSNTPSRSIFAECEWRTLHATGQAPALELVAALPTPHQYLTPNNRHRIPGGSCLAVVERVIPKFILVRVDGKLLSGSMKDCWEGTDMEQSLASAALTLPKTGVYAITDKVIAVDRVLYTLDHPTRLPYDLPKLAKEVGIRGDKATPQTIRLKTPKHSDKDRSA